MDNAMKKTPWFPSRVNPARKGNYETNTLGQLRWTGAQWLDLYDCWTNFGRGGWALGDRWRGLTTKDGK